LESTFWGLVALFLGAYAFGLIAQCVWHFSEKRRKWNLMVKHPHLAKEIMQDIERQDAQFAQSYRDRSNAFERKPKPKAGSGMLRAGLFIAKRLMK
jgi:hypothetical protein